MDNLPNNQPSQPQVIIPQKSFFQSLWGKLTIFLALVVLLGVALVALNYFNIIPLSQKFSFLNSLPTKQIQTIKQDNTIAQTSSIQNPNQPESYIPPQNFLNNPLFHKAGQAGYRIIRMDPQDSSGRTVFYDDRQKADFNYKDSGIIYRQSANSSTVNATILQIIGTFTNFENIDKDLYVNLINPQTKKSLPKVRLVLEKTAAKSLTGFTVEDLSYGPNNPFKGNQTFVLLDTLGQERLKKIIIPGDTVILNVASKDENDQIIAPVIVIRRFGGKSTIEQELGKQFPP